ncbi:MAG: carbohydrate-binding protein [Bacteroidales bacterium]
MGGNPINKVYVTGLGESHVETLLHLDSWFDGIDPMVPGIVPYGLHTYGSWMDNGSGNVYQPLGNFESCYPNWQDWPSHEIWFENRYLIIQNEFTVQQTQGPATGAYAYLCAPLHTTGIEVQEISLNYDTIDLDKGTSLRLIAAISPYDAENKNISWYSGDPSAVIVQDGIINAIGEGEAWIYTESEQGSFKDSCLVKSSENIEVSGINILEEAVEILQGSRDTLHAVIIPENATNPDFSWSVENSVLVDIDREGVIIAKEPGQTTITATTDQGTFTDQSQVTVLEAPQYPFPYSVHLVPGRIEFEDYDIGGQYISYNESTLENEGNAYREDEVDIQETDDDQGEYNVGWIRDGEWLEYTVNVSETGKYYLFLRAAVNSDSSSLKITENKELLLSKELEYTGGWQSWETFIDSVDLSEGEQILRFTFNGGESLFNLNWIEFNKNLWMTGKQEISTGPPNGLKIYPNPVGEFFFLNSEKPLNQDLLIIINDISGKTIKIIKPENVYSGSFKVAVEELDAGIYFLLTKENNKTFSKPLKIIKL